MKFWKKIFLYSITLFLVLLIGAGTFLIEKTHEANLEESIRMAIEKYSDMEYTLYLNADYLSNIDMSERANIKNWIDIIVNGYSINSNLEAYNIELYTEENELITSKVKLPANLERKELINATSEEKIFLIRTIDKRKTVFVSSIINLQNTKYKLVLSRDIQSVYERKTENYEIILMVGMGVTIILAMGMYVISKKLTNPIERLSEISKEIEKGNYSKRVLESGDKDEIGVLQVNFNKMLEVIENNIKELNDMNESKQRFIDSLNHEIKTPITSILGYSDLLLKSKVSEETQIMALMYINSEAKRLELLNSTLLKLIFLREEQINKEELLLSTTIRDAKNTLQYKLEMEQIQFELDIEDQTIYADKGQMEVLLINIMDNAMKASTSNSSIKIEGRYNEESQSYTLKIKDYGIGIPKEDLDKIIEPFYMVDKARTRKYNGVGLGLAICNEICLSHQIILSIESEVGVGTEITLELDRRSIVL